MMRRFTLPLIFLALAAGTALVLKFAVPMSADRALASGFAKLRDAEHLSGIATVAMLLPRAEAEKDSTDDRVPLALRGSFKIDLPKDGRPSADVAFGVSGDAETKDIRVDVRALADGTAYFKTENLPEGAFGAVSLQQLNGTWWSLDAQTFGQMLVAKNVVSATPAEAADDQAAAWYRLRDLAFGGSMFVTDGKAVRERVGDVMTYRIALGVRREEAQAFAKELRTALLGHALDETEAAAAAKDASELAARVTVWVTPKDGTMVQARIELESADSSEAMQTILLEALDTVTPADVQAPEASTPFEELVLKR